MPRPRPLPSARAVVLAGGAALLLATALAGCAKDGSTGSISDRTIPAVTPDTGAGPTRTIPPTNGSRPGGSVIGPSGGSATIADFAVSTKLSCTRGAPVSVTATYRTIGAAEVAFLLDGTAVPGAPKPSGSFDLTLPCDGGAHTLVLTALDPQGKATVASKAILTDVPPEGD